MKFTKILLGCFAASVTLISHSANLLTKGNYYFENIVTNWESPKMVIETENNTTYVFDLTPSQDDPLTWERIFTSNWDTLFKYTAFIDTELPEGEYSMQYDDFVTAYTASGDVHGYTVKYQPYFATNKWAIGGCMDNIFVPFTPYPNTMGSWMRKDFRETKPSGTIPTLYITTDDGYFPYSKEDYQMGAVYLESNGVEGVEDVGSAQKPVVTQVKGRGNWSWYQCNQKALRLKLDKKTSFFGMEKSKHYALLNAGAVPRNLFTSQLGFGMGELLGMAWTPDTHAVELMVNGVYWGVYFLTETIRVDSKRVNIVNQEDEYDENDVSGGYLVEIDNTEDENQIVFTSASGRSIRFTIDTPDSLHLAQRDYMTSQLEHVDNAIVNATASDDVWNTVDITSLAQHYLVKTFMDDVDGYCGSCYLYNRVGGEH